jgi:HD-like signal output (HDOD) protein
MSTQSVSPLPSKEESLENCLRLIHRQSNLPAFSHHMAELAHAMAAESTTLNLLTNIILKNVSLTAMVLRLANSFHYNPRGRPILSVSRAVTMIGWDSIRNLGAGVLLFEHFRRQSDKLKELTLQMLLTGNLSRQIAIRAGLRGIEEAYLCGMLRNLGELMVACYLPGEYERILECMNRTKSAGTEACECLLNFRFEDLGKAMARHWNLPDTVSHCMDRPDLMAPKDADELRIISAFSHALSDVVYRTEHAECQEALKALLKRYGAAAPVKECDIPAILDAAVFETEDTFRAARLPIDHASLASRILAVTGRGHTPAPVEKSPEPAVDSDVLQSLTQELRSMLRPEEDFDLNAVLMMILEAVYRGAGLDRALFCLVNGDQTEVEARLGVGADVERLIARFRFRLSIRSGPIGVALLKKEDLIVEAGPGSVYSRSPFMDVVGARCFGILPLIAWMALPSAVCTSIPLRRDSPLTPGAGRRYSNCGNSPLQQSS